MRLAGDSGAAENLNLIALTGGIMEAKRRGIRIDPSDLALEIVSIVIAILLALAVNRWQEGLAHERTLHESLVSIRQELVDNRAALTQRMALHRRVAGAFMHFVTVHQPPDVVTFPDVYRIFRTAAPRGFQPVRGVDIAWQVAQSSQALTFMPYATRVTLTGVYDEQNSLYMAELRFLDAAFSPSAASKDYYVQAFAAALWLIEVTNAESELLRRYDAALRILPTA
jgi:hypothetical protein